MFAVIFRAVISEADEEYEAMAEKMQRMAFNQYGCVEFTSCREGDEEISISYWESEKQTRSCTSFSRPTAVSRLKNGKLSIIYRWGLLTYIQCLSRPRYDPTD